MIFDPVRLFKHPLTVLAAPKSAASLALMVFELVWGWFWRLGLSLLATIAIVTMLDGWE
ncbi:hypothetical protein VB780_12405 [Leptolyngbya sp. CCNP1308]|uniref:hypothetical protein n=1 Tax=Leptolyngbya sp. CCNP1308 TaxID=3110255 RepID=UPI002B20FFA1|nr:hypothetical protein [Leptolyngbya sp. CCNP1308]MEA5449376.1 hypothetical protein [Leptolyngbya sp. CCNP1308]